MHAGCSVFYLQTGQGEGCMLVVAGLLRPITARDIMTSFETVMPEKV